MKDSNLEDWQRKENSYTNPDIQNEIFRLMNLHIPHDISSDLLNSPFLQ